MATFSWGRPGRICMEQQHSIAIYKRTYLREVKVHTYVSNTFSVFYNRISQIPTKSIVAGISPELWYLRVSPYLTSSITHQCIVRSSEMLVRPLLDRIKENSNIRHTIDRSETLSIEFICSNIRNQKNWKFEERFRCKTLEYTRCPFELLRVLLDECSSKRRL